MVDEVEGNSRRGSVLYMIRDESERNCKGVTKVGVAGENNCVIWVLPHTISPEKQILTCPVTLMRRTLALE